MRNLPSTASLSPAIAADPPYRDAGVARPTIAHEWRADGSLLMRAVDAPVRVAELGFSGFVPRWAATRGDQPAFSQRSCPDSWRTLTWAEFHRRMLSVAAGLLEMGLTKGQPLMILSGNSLEQAVLTAAAEYVGIPVAPVSPAYSLQSQEFTRLLDLRELVEPAAVFVQSTAPFAKALQAVGLPDAVTIAVDGAAPGQVDWRSLADGALTLQRQDAVETAHAAVRTHDIARIFFTSGSTGAPKGVPLTYANLAMMCGQMRYANAPSADQAAVMLDWLPWNHAFAGVGNLGRAFTLGASYYIDDGRPLPGQIERTVQNLREVAPTLYANVPGAWALLATELARDEALARNFFSRLRYAGYGGASLPRDVWERFQATAVRTVGERIVFMSGFGATETSALGMNFSQPCDDVGNIGVPMPGMEVKLVPLPGDDGRYDVRMRGPHLFPGYLKRPDLTAAAFDDEGYYRLGDAVRLANPEAPAEGLRYAGRCVEDFKLANGTWVRTGSVRVGLIAQCGPLLADAVICGHDRDYVAALAWPNVAACQGLAPELAGLPARDLVVHPLVVDALRRKLQAQDEGPVSGQVRRVLLMADAPSPDANEIADKGYINQAMARERRAHLIEPLYAEPADASVASAH